MLWLVFHLPFGFPVLIPMLPILVVIPWIAQKTRSTWAGIVLHALANGPAFVLIALGVIS
jgi:membrane protease YdiL (CAAX protease family)